MKILTLVIIFLCWFAGSVMATGQAAERIIIGSDTLAMLACPLEQDSILSGQVQKLDTKIKKNIDLK